MTVEEFFKRMTGTPEPERPEEPEVPERPEEPEVPETPEEPVVPETPEEPEVPETPGEPVIPKALEQTLRELQDEIKSSHEINARLVRMLEPSTPVVDDDRMFDGFDKYMEKEKK